ncbi:unnamed protein product [Caenorhabditis brenneri]
MTKRKLASVYQHDGYSFRFAYKLKDGSELLYCSERKTEVGCMASAKKINGKISIIRDHYGHEPNKGLAAAKVARMVIREKADSSNLTPREIVFNAKREFGAVPIQMAGSLSSINRMIHRVRVKDSVDVANANLKNPVFTGDMRLTNEKTPFLQFDDVVPSTGGRVVCFSSYDMLTKLGESDVLLTDGTFDCVRAPFMQLWTLHGRLTPTATVPLAFVIMSRRSRDDYAYVLESLKKLPVLSSWNPKDFIGDLESAQEKAIKDCFPTIKEHYCLFHVMQAWRRKLDKLGLKEEILYDNKYYEFWSLLKSLPFVPPSDVEDYFSKLVDILPASKCSKMKSFEEYLRRYYIGPRPNLPYPPTNRTQSEADKIDELCDAKVEEAIQKLDLPDFGPDKKKFNAYKAIYNLLLNQVYREEKTKGKMKKEFKNFEEFFNKRYEQVKDKMKKDPLAQKLFLFEITDRSLKIDKLRIELLESMCDWREGELIWERWLPDLTDPMSEDASYHYLLLEKIHMGGPSAPGSLFSIVSRAL